MAKILIADSLQELLTQDESIRSRPDVLILAASSAEEMLEIHRKERADLIVLDMDMPEMGGDSLCASIRKDAALKTVSIIVACENTEEALSRCMSCGANSLIMKPVYERELIKKTGELLDIPLRESLRVLMNISVNGRSGRGEFYCSSKNISTTGILLETTKPLAKGDKVTFTFLLRLNRIIVEGKIIRVEKKAPNLFQYGIKFIDLPLQSKALIEEYVKIRRAL
jgi:CheY-like chemotaxis protein